MYNALYARQSIEKTDSISVESQLEYCKYETHGEPYTEYIDRGYSGKNTNRPDFEKMMNDIKKGMIKRVIVYKLDRISRSILDFANMMEIFQKYNVEFVSSTEKFDTSTPIGRAMLNICIVFAQLERETIQKRVSDAYYSRNKKGLYMGGKIPYGFKRVPITIDNIKTSMFVEVPEESEQIKLMFSMYANTDKSLGEIIGYFVENSVKNLRASIWSTSRISELLRNPIYVKADINVYNFFKSHGAKVIDDASKFNGINGCYLYKGENSTANKNCDLSEAEIVLAPHQGFISSEVWLKCRIRCLNNHQSTKTQKPKNSWLCGKIKCGNCGYALTIKKSKTKWSRYFICSSQRTTSLCKGTGCTVYADVLEEYMLKAIRDKLSTFKQLSSQDESISNPRLNQIEIRLSQIKNNIDDLLSKVGKANDILIQYINNKVSEFDVERKNLEKEAINLNCNTKDNLKNISDHVEKWEILSFEDKQSVVDALIEVIHISNGNIEITWRI